MVIRKGSERQRSESDQRAVVVKNGNGNIRVLGREPQFSQIVVVQRFGIHEDIRLFIKQKNLLLIRSIFSKAIQYRLHAEQGKEIATHAFRDNSTMLSEGVDGNFFTLFG